MDSSNYPQPQDASETPRYASIATFMRLPQILNPDDVDIGIIGVPWDGGTTNRAGARHGPRQIREMSSFIRQVHPVSKIAPFELVRIADFGDAPVNPIDLEETLMRLETFYARLHQANVTPLSVGGDHLITLPILRVIGHDNPVGMIQIDAHSDTNDTYFGGRKFTHGTPFRRAVEEGVLDPKRTVQVGIRGSIYRLEEHDFALQSGMRLITIEEFSDLGVQGTLAEVRNVVGYEPTYLSFDIDSIDPAFAPGTGTPEIGGLTTREAQNLLRGLSGLNLVGGDVVEVAPPFDSFGNTALVAANMMFEILCLLANGGDKENRVFQ